MYLRRNNIFMSINSNCIANPKNAHIKKTDIGESPDYISLKTIKNADTSTIEGIKLRNKAILELKERYRQVIEGSKNKLREMCSGHYTVLSNDILDNYEYDCYEHFMMAVDGMDLKRIQHMKGSYSFYIQLVRYLAAYNRKIINQYCGGTPKEKPLSVFRPANSSDKKTINIKVNGKEVKVVQLRSTDELHVGYILRNHDMKTFIYNPDYTYIRDKLGKLIKVLDNDNEVIFNDPGKKIRKLDEFNVRSEWMSGPDGTDISVFNTDDIRYTTIEEEMEHKEESKVLREAIDNAYAKFSGLQKSIWNSRMNQSAEQYEKKLNSNESAAKLEKASKPKFEDLGKRCDVSASVIKENMNAMREIVSLEIDAANRKYHTHVKF